MNKQELLEILNVDKLTEELKNHPKLLQLLNYCNLNDADIYEHNFDIHTDAFLLFLDNIHSIETLLIVLKNSGNLLNLNYYPKEMAEFYNLYNPEKIQFSLDTIILMDEEYLKYATKEWTENNFMNSKKIINITNNKIIIKDNSKDEDDDNYIASYLINADNLKKAKELGLLKEAINKLIEKS